ncbi:MAG: NAD(P)/FAD-dependent oxidoreductase [Gammaproteobacteria bacterium]|nr:NAD(P)/FAD-dependent oxidoreductase [Gammaproteobacteria bacterium]MDE2349221.1 NAD(P)/FAD-dependent oxidoreductase [Gammaproteobacteria bacterium]
MIARFPEQQAVATDAVIVGAGPVGLFQVFELGLLGLKAEVIDSLRSPGGQCTELYPDKPIYDIPAVPVCTGAELTQRLKEQIAPFAPGMHFGQEVTRVERQASGRFLVGTSTGSLFDAGVVIIAAGVGAFQPRRLDVEGAGELEGRALHYRVSDPAAFAGRELVICGGGDSALDWAVALADKARSVVVVHRRAEFRAAHATVEKLRRLQDEGRADILIGNVQALDRDGGKLTGLRVQCSDGLTRRLAADQILVFFGLHPKLGPIAEWGLSLERKALKVDTARFETSIPGIFAVGDINTYPGKKKLILSGFHEAALAAFAAKEHLYPGEKVRLQYTTTSPIMHRRLGVDADSDSAAA